MSVQIPVFPTDAAPLHAAALGATLYVPATRTDMLAIALGEKHPALRSVVLCLEDSVADCAVTAALANIAAVLRCLQLIGALPAARPALFIRPRNLEMLDHIKQLEGADHIHGYVIPKATADSLPAWLAAITTPHHQLLPTIETREAFDPAEMRRLRTLLLTEQHRILAIRIGGNDLLQTLGARRSARRTAYDGPLGHTIASLVTTFIPWGFAMSAPVFEDFTNTALLEEEIERDLDHGLLTKTAIHPAQVEAIHNAYRVSRPDYDQAIAIAGHHAPAVFALGGAMCEPATHMRWATRTITRAEIFGLERSRPENVSIAS